MRKSLLLFLTLLSSLVFFSCRSSQTASVLDFPIEEPGLEGSESGKTATGAPRGAADGGSGRVTQGAGEVAGGLPGAADGGAVAGVEDIAGYEMELFTEAMGSGADSPSRHGRSRALDAADATLDTRRDPVSLSESRPSLELRGTGAILLPRAERVELSDSDAPRARSTEIGPRLQLPAGTSLSQSGPSHLAAGLQWGGISSTRLGGSLELPEQRWSRVLGGRFDEIRPLAIQTSDMGYIVAGQTESFGFGEPDLWVLKLRNDGNLAWHHTYGGEGYEFSKGLIATSDGGYLLAGSTGSFGTATGGERPMHWQDLWILKLANDGVREWSRTFGTAGDHDSADSLVATNDGGYLISGRYGDALFTAGPWVLKLEGNGAPEWQRLYGGSTMDYRGPLIKTSDGGYLLATQTEDYDSAIQRIWLLKIGADAGVSWARVLGTGHYEGSSALVETSDGGYLLAGFTTTSLEADSGNIWLLKLKSNGEVGWSRTYGGSGHNYSRALITTSDGGYLLAGYTTSFGAGHSDVWLLKLEGNGEVEWSRTYGGSGYESSGSLIATSDGGYLVAAETDSFGAGEIDLWILKLDREGLLSFSVGHADERAEIHDVTSQIQVRNISSDDGLQELNVSAFWIRPRPAAGVVSQEIDITNIHITTPPLE